jgi:glucose/arabinose dehydrogenase
MACEYERKFARPRPSALRPRGVARLAALLFALVLIASTAGPPPSAFSQDDLVEHRLHLALSTGTKTVSLWVERGFDIGVAAAEIPSARMIAQSPSGELVVSQTFAGTVSKLADHDGDGDFEERTAMLRDLDSPHGLAFVGDALYVATTDQILRLQPWWDGSTAQEVAKLPGGGKHVTRTLVLGSDGLLYVSIGSSCDACHEDDARRAAILRFDPASGVLEPVAHGIRNAVGMAWGPHDGRLWVTDNGRNDLGDELPPDEVDVVQIGADYGWPDCLGQRVPATPDVSPERCADTEAPVVELPAHIAPLGLAFYDSERAPPGMRGDLLVALHGSAERSDLIGYELVRIPMRDGQPGSPRTFVRGWLVGDESWGRPVAPFVAADGTIYVSDDKGGVVYWLRQAD